MKTNCLVLFTFAVFLTGCSSMSGAFAPSGKENAALDSNVKVSIYVSGKANAELGVYGKRSIRKIEGSLKLTSEMPAHTVIGKGVVKRYPGNPDEMLEQAMMDARKAGANGIIITDVWSETVYNVLSGKPMGARRNYIKYDGVRIGLD